MRRPAHLVLLLALPLLANCTTAAGKEIKRMEKKLQADMESGQAGGFTFHLHSDHPVKYC